jgi:magnesium transporter
MPTLEETLADQLHEALRLPAADGGGLAMQAVLSPQRPADIAAAMRRMTMAEALGAFAWLSNQQAGEVLNDIDPELTRYLIENAPPARIADVLDLMPSDNAAEVISEAGLSRTEDILRELEAQAPGDAEAVRALLAYPDRTAGRIMTHRFASARPTTTAGVILAILHRRAHELDAVSNVYATDPEGRLLGVASIRDVLAASATATLAEIMTHEPVTVGPEEAQEEVARAIARYDLSALPVVDDEGTLLGIVTVDDAMDVVVEELSEDFFRFAGSDADEMDRRTPAQVARLRLPWLMGTMAIELGAGAVISRFDDVLVNVILLASFMPVISAISGNVGLQAAAIVVRGLDTGHVSLRHWGKQVTKELSTSFLLALACALVLGTIGAIWSQHIPFGIVIGGALLCSMMTAGMMGSIIPMLSKRLGFDPATTAGPFETAFQDVIGFAVFLWLASLLQQWLV